MVLPSTVAPKRIVMIGPFGLQPRMTMRVRALPLAKALVRQGNTVTVLLPPWQNPQDGGRVWTEDGVRIENVDLPLGIPGWFHGQLTRRLVRRTVALDPDIVHTFKPKAYAGLAHLALARRYPVVVDTDDWEGAGGWNAMGDYSPLLQRLFAWQERWGLGSASAVTVASRALQTLTWSIGGAPERVFYLPNGASVSEFEVVPSMPGRPTVLLYTRFFEFDLDRLWRVMCVVRDSRHDVRFLVVGKGFADEEDRLLALAAGAGWRVVRSETPVIASAADVPDGDLVYVGWGTEANLAACFGSATLGIYPFDDTLLNRTKCPMKLMDMLSAGIPVVADAVGQITEAVVPGKTGQLVRAGDDRAFAEAVAVLLADPEALRAMGRAAKADVARRFGWDGLADIASAAYLYAANR
ncbi:MAG: glycosyltransferase family 4 protein [Anaerolineae bacterium]|nr:glycosyltransferase family 4 protein [Anaerolineae bacterium]